MRCAIRHMGDGLPHAEQQSALGHCIQLRNTWQLDERLRSIVLDLSLARRAAELLGAPGLQLYSDLLVVREPGGPDDDWHLDAVRMPVPGDAVVAAYIPLSPASAGEGSLDLLVGSHLLPECSEFKLHRATTLKRIRGRLVRSGLPLLQASPVPGDVTFITGNVFHRVRQSALKVPSVTLWVYYFLAGQTLIRPKNPFQALERERHFAEVAVGRPVLTPLTPLVCGKWVSARASG
ncbi:MAG TPA: phytanoyl-CoA dioxygenase family protein [Tepidisphaeraceae bacterium]|nr:phytanoyl-CoA dioxygenase family protein [Tepidisphaeraceae bacterium]